MNLGGYVNLGKAMSGNINIDKFRINTHPLPAMVPGRFRNQVADIPLKKPVDITKSTGFSLAGSRTSADLNMLTKIPDYGVNDLALAVSVEQDADAKRIRVNKVNLEESMNRILAKNGTVDME
jgi:hypothetical protein